MADQIFIAWTKFQRRPESMQSHFGYTLHYVPPPFAATWAKPFGYIVQSWKTLRLIRNQKPRVLWIQLPPTFLPFLALMARCGAGASGMRIIADCHNRTFRPPWSRIPRLAKLLNRLDLVIAHNEEMRGAATAMGVCSERLHILETRPARFGNSSPLPSTNDASQPVILVPCSFNPDEPVDALLKAAIKAPDLKFLVTGDRAKARSKGIPVDRAPGNLVFTGFLSKEDYEGTLLGADVILGLTTIEGIQLSVANEAVGAGKAMVLSDTQILRTLFGDAALFTENEGEAIADACRGAAAEKTVLEARSVKLLAARERRWLGQAEPLSTILS